MIIVSAYCASSRPRARQSIVAAAAAAAAAGNNAHAAPSARAVYPPRCDFCLDRSNSVLVFKIAINQNVNSQGAP